jgi:hypothetical protein
MAVNEVIDFFEKFLELEIEMEYALYKDKTGFRYKAAEKKINSMTSYSFYNQGKYLFGKNYNPADFNEHFENDNSFVDSWKKRKIFFVKEYRNYFRIYVSCQSSFDEVTDCFFVEKADNETGFAVTAFYSLEPKPDQYNYWQYKDGKKYNTLTKLLYKHIINEAKDPDDREGDVEIKARFQSDYGEIVLGPVYTVYKYETGEIKQGGFLKASNLKIGCNTLRLDGRATFYKSGRVYESFLAKKTKAVIGDNEIELGESKSVSQFIRFDETGNIIHAIPACDTEIKAGENILIFKKRQDMKFYSSGTFRTGVLSCDSEVNLGTSEKLIASQHAFDRRSNAKKLAVFNGKISFYESGKVQFINKVKSEINWIIGEFEFNNYAGTSMYFYESGEVMYLTIGEDAVVEYAGSSVNLERGTCLWFTEKGGIMALGLNSGPNGFQTSFYHNGNKISLKKAVFDMAVSYKDYNKKEIDNIIMPIEIVNQIRGKYYIDFVYHFYECPASFDLETGEQEIEWSDAIVSIMPFFDNIIEYGKGNLTTKYFYKCYAGIWIKFDQEGNIVSGADLIE